MRGQKLYIRPIDFADQEEVRRFLAHNSTSSKVPRSGLIGKLVGELVAVLAMEITTDGVRVDDLVVAQELRRKRIGRIMLSELDTIAAKVDRDWLIVERDDKAREFLRKVGFTGEKKMVRKVRK